MNSRKIVVGSISSLVAVIGASSIVFAGVGAFDRRIENHPPTSIELSSASDTTVASETTTPRTTSGELKIGTTSVSTPSTVVTTTAPGAAATATTTATTMQSADADRDHHSGNHDDAIQSDDPNGHDANDLNDHQVGGTSTSVPQSSTSNASATNQAGEDVNSYWGIGGQGADDPADHDANDDHGRHASTSASSVPTTATSSPAPTSATTVTTASTTAATTDSHRGGSGSGSGSSSSGSSGGSGK